VDAERLRTAWRRARRRVLDDSRDDAGEPWTTAHRPSGRPDTDERPGAQPGADGAGATAAISARRDGEAHADATVETGAGATAAISARRDGEAHADATVETVAGAALVSALNRVADSFEKVVESLDTDRRERWARLDDLDTLLRELVISLRPPTSVPPVIVGGSIDPSVEEQIDLSQPDIAIDPGTRGP
jgi:hypothetical protein